MIWAQAKNQETAILGDSCSSQTIQNFVDVKTDSYRFRIVESSGVLSFVELVLLIVGLFLSRHYRNQSDPDDKLPTAIFPRHNFTY
ncbi:hypothetical protein NQ317_007637 [Molorchus minor]|uniref:Uncharacterized protein n=1 Tax=Molorchus minor TaxID=1323400 RepID=A0ABQ9JBI5_9CUCU|nr:hypothetical protein NQ317_007637 [Molorchus minor]